MEEKAWDILLKAGPIGVSVIILGLAAIKAFIKYQVKKDADIEAFYKDQLKKKDDIIQRKDEELKALNMQLMALITKNIDVANALKAMIRKALQKIPDDDDDS